MNGNTRFVEQTEAPTVWFERSQEVVESEVRVEPHLTRYRSLQDWTDPGARAGADWARSEVLPAVTCHVSVPKSAF